MLFNYYLYFCIIKNGNMSKIHLIKGEFEEKLNFLLNPLAHSSKNSQYPS